MPVSGSCHCGGVRITVPHPPEWVTELQLLLVRQDRLAGGLLSRRDVRIEGETGAVYVGRPQHARTVRRCARAHEGGQRPPEPVLAGGSERGCRRRRGDEHGRPSGAPIRGSAAPNVPNVRTDEGDFRRRGVCWMVAAVHREHKPQKRCCRTGISTRLLGGRPRMATVSNCFFASGDPAWPGARRSARRARSRDQAPPRRRGSAGGWPC